MSVIATVVVDADGFVLGEALATDPGMRITLERLVPLGSTFVPYFWVEDDSVAEIERALHATVEIESFTVVDRVDDEALVRVEWADDLGTPPMAEAGASILQGVGSADGWTFQLRFVDHDALTTFYRQCTERGIELDLQSIHNPGVPEDDGLGFGLTEPQREALRIALEQGYFEVPRRMNLSDLAGEMGVSDTAVSQRIRRGISTLLVRTLSDAVDEPSPDR